MSRPEKTPKKRRERTLFGEWYRFLCEYVHADQTTIQRASGFGEGTVSRLAREGWNSPKRETVDRLWATIEQFALRLDRPLPEAWKVGFYHAGGVATDHDKLEAKELLRRIRLELGVPDGPSDAPNNV